MDCKRIGCSGRVQPNGTVPFAVCQECRSPNCLRCSAIHENQSCKKYQNSIQYKGSPGKIAAVAIDDNSSEKLVQCKVVGCDGRAFVDKTDALFRCPLCNHYTCINCEAVHESMTCAQYRENKDSIAAPVHKPRRQSEEDSEEAEVEKPEQPAADDDAEGMIVDCCYEGCSGYAYVFKTATVAKCELCEHWTCVSCKACHESQSCAVYKGIDVPEECAAQEPTVSENQRRGRNREQKSVSAGSTEHGGFLSGVLKNFGKLLSGSGSGTVEESPAQMPLASSSADNYRSHPGRVPCARGHTEFEKVQGNGIPPCDACSSRKSDHTAEECQHALCRQCIQKSVEKATVYRSVPCPAPAGNSQPCTGHLREEEVQQVVPRNILRNLFKKSDWRDSQCFDKRCSHAFRRKKGAQFFTCPMCRRKNCADCLAIHEGMTCEQYIEKFVADMDRGKLEGNGIPPCDACSSRKSDHTAEECQHALCRQCIQKSVEKATVYRSVPCPAPAGNSQPCTGHLREEEVQQVVPRNILRNLFKKSDWRDSQCFDKRCSHAFRRKKGAQFFTCPMCRRKNCADCLAIHEGMTCEQYIEKFVADMDRGKLENPEEKKKRLQEQIALYERPSIQTTEEFECPICLVEVEPGMGIVLKNCHHQICEQCLADTAKNSQAAEVLCPCKSDDADCQMPVLDSDLRACLSEADYAALQERGLREAENASKEPSFHCKTPDCKGWCLHGREVEVFDCPVCQRQNCLRCEAIHKDMSCADYQADLKRRAENDVAARASLNFLEEMLKTEQAMRCPQCRVVIIKRSGCDFMVCTSCKTQLCWATKGARWGPGGQGDTSGGCRCGVGGVKCHPKCTTCH
ncbi:uncharacterized protein LOC144113085 isoform X2 [Amblyomma americanum]